MDLKDVDILQLCPAFMREDRTNQLLAQGSNNIFRKWAQNAERLVIVNQIDNLSGAELDQLARDTNVFWYDEKANIDVKRALIKNSPIVFNRLGTVWAVESVMN
ncbi:MAG: phage tail protein I, partial [Clostridia bacterium]|nr:phage tail protein I [Clostridia bacterium]